MQLPIPPASVHGASPSSYADADGVVFFSVFANGGQRVYKVVDGQAQEIALEHLPTARGRLSVEPGGLWLTAWDDHATALWRIQVPGWKPWPAPPGPAGKSIRYGSRAPTLADGVAGEFWIDTSVMRIYGPKTPGTWGAGTSLVGPPGPAGRDGSGGASEAEAKLAAIRAIVDG